MASPRSIPDPPHNDASTRVVQVREPIDLDFWREHRHDLGREIAQPGAVMYRVEPVDGSRRESFHPHTGPVG